VPDTDDEFYDRAEIEESDGSDDSNAVNNKDDRSTGKVATKSSELSSTHDGGGQHLSDSDTTEHLPDRHSRDSSAVAMDTVANETGHLKRAKVDDDVEAVAKKCVKLDDSASVRGSDVNSHGGYLWVVLRPHTRV